MLRFKDNDVVLPITIIEELDRFKKQPEMTGRNARQASRKLDELRQQGQLTEGVPINGGGNLRVALCHRETLQELPTELVNGHGDNAILAVALELKRQVGYPVVVVSKDTNLRIKANALGLVAEDYATDKVDLEELYTGITEVIVEAEQIDQLFKQGAIGLDGHFFPNQAVTLIDAVNPSHTALAIVDGTSGKISPLVKLPHYGVSRIQPRNREQNLCLSCCCEIRFNL